MEPNLTNKLNPNRTNELLETWKGKVTQDQMLDALSFAISNLEIDPEISRQAYRIRLDNIIESDEYNPNGRKKGQNFGRVSNDRWVNRIPNHCKPTCIMIVDDIFQMLEDDTGYDNLAEINHLRNRITQLFINLRGYSLDIEHYNKIRYYILKTLDSYGEVDLMMKVNRFD
jgi:hypothetical protein